MESKKFSKHLSTSTYIIFSLANDHRDVKALAQLCHEDVEELICSSVCVRVGYPCTRIHVHDVSCTVYTRLNVICRNLAGLGPRAQCDDIDIEFPASRRRVLNRSISHIHVN